MRYKYIEDASQDHNKKQILIALNINELNLLCGMSAQIAANIPRTGQTKRLHQVAKQMTKEMAISIKELHKLGVEEISELKYPYNEKSIL